MKMLKNFYRQILCNKYRYMLNIKPVKYSIIYDVEFIKTYLDKIKFDVTYGYKVE